MQVACGSGRGVTHEHGQSNLADDGAEMLRGDRDAGVAQPRREVEDPELGLRALGQIWVLVEEELEDLMEGRARSVEGHGRPWQVEEELDHLDQPRHRQRARAAHL